MRIGADGDAPAGVGRPGSAAIALRAIALRAIALRALPLIALLAAACGLLDGFGSPPDDRATLTPSSADVDDGGDPAAAPVQSPAGDEDGWLRYVEWKIAHRGLLRALGEGATGGGPLVESRFAEARRRLARLPIPAETLAERDQSYARLLGSQRGGAPPAEQVDGHRDHENAIRADCGREE